MVSGITFPEHALTGHEALGHLAAEQGLKGRGLNTVEGRRRDRIVGEEFGGVHRP